MSRYGLARLLAVAVALGGTACSRQASNIGARSGRSNALAGAYVPPSTWYGDGATNDGAGGWAITSARPG